MPRFTAVGFAILVVLVHVAFGLHGCQLSRRIGARKWNVLVLSSEMVRILAVLKGKSDIILSYEGILARHGRVLRHLAFTIAGTTGKLLSMKCHPLCLYAVELLITSFQPRKAFMTFGIWPSQTEHVHCISFLAGYFLMRYGNQLCCITYIKACLSQNYLLIKPEIDIGYLYFSLTPSLPAPLRFIS